MTTNTTKISSFHPPPNHSDPFRIVFISSGANSWAAGKRVAERYGTDNLLLLFADTLAEDEDNYRFLLDAADNIGGRLVKVCDGRTLWEVYTQTKWISSRGPKCSKLLKVKPCENWIRECEFDPSNTVLYFGIDWTELDRMTAIAQNWNPFKVETPLCWDDWKTWLDREGVFRWAKAEGLKLPRLYERGFPHANCGGFCPRAGKSQFERLFEAFPDRYKEHEQQEQKWQQTIGKPATVLTETVAGQTRTLSLKQYRERIEAGGRQLSVLEDWGSCGCFASGNEPHPTTDKYHYLN